MFILVISGIEERTTPTQVIEKNKNKLNNDERLEEMETFLMGFLPEEATNESHGLINKPEITAIENPEPIIPVLPIEPAPSPPPPPEASIKSQQEYTTNPNVGESTASNEAPDAVVTAELEAKEGPREAFFVDKTDEAKEKEELEKARKAEEVKKTEEAKKKRLEEALKIYSQLSQRRIETPSSTLEYLLQLLHDLQYNTENPDQEAISKILEMIQNIKMGYYGYKNILGND